MNRDTGHPEDFSPYLDKDVLDPKHEEIRLHLSECSRCRDEVRRWQSVEAMFRSGESEIELPPFQWQRIAARLQPQPPLGLLARFQLQSRPWKLAWNMTLGTLLLGAMIVSGLEYRKYSEEKQLLLAVAQYAKEEGRRIAEDGNPFRIATAAENNPFAQSHFAQETKNSAGRSQR